MTEYNVSGPDRQGPQKTSTDRQLPNADTKATDSPERQKHPSRSSLHAAARRYASQGLPVFPIKPGAKTPLTAHGYKDATTAVGMIDEWWTANPDANIAFSPDDKGLVVIDVDRAKPGFDEIDLLSLNLPATRTVQSPSGGEHLYFKGSGPSTTGKLATCVDTRGRGGYVLLPPSIVDGKPYTFTDKREPVALPTEIEAQLSAEDRAEPSKHAGQPIAPNVLRDALSYLDPGCSRDDWRNIVAGIHAADGSVDVADEWSRGVLDRQGRYADSPPPNYVSIDDVGLVYDSMAPKAGGIGVGTLVDLARQHGWQGNSYDSGKSAAETFAGADIPSIVPEVLEPLTDLDQAIAQVEADQSREETLRPGELSLFIEEQDKRRLEFLQMLNRHFAMVRVGGETHETRIVEFTNGGQSISFIKSQEDFLLRFKPLKVYCYGGQKETKWREVAPMWLQWPDRRQYLNDGLVFAPGQPLEWLGGLNRWRGFAIEPKQGDWSPLRDLIENVLCGGNTELSEYVQNWLAHIVQRPGVLTNTAIVMRSEHEGAGKGLLGHTVGSFFGENYRYISKGDDVTGRFNGGLTKCLYAVLDEAMYAGDHEASEQLKTLISDQARRSEEKFMPVEMVPNHINLMIFGNNDWLVRTGLNNRRLVYIDVPARYKPDDHYWLQFWIDQPCPGKPWISIKLPPLAMRQAMLYDLLHRDISGFNPRHIPHTIEEGRQKRFSQNGLGKFLHDVLDGGEIECTSAMGHSIYTHTWPTSEPFTITRQNFRNALRHWWREQRERGTVPSDAEIGKTLHKMLGDAVKDSRPRDDKSNSSRARCYTFAPLLECRKEFERSYGSPIEWSDLAIEDEEDSHARD